MFFTLLTEILKGFIIGTGSYGNKTFPEALSKEKEEELINEMNLGNKDARNKLIEHNLRLVAHIVKKYDSKTEDTDDLISIGTIGLIKGIDTYSNKKNSKNISINDSVGFDKDGNEISFLDILKTPNPDFISDIDLKDNIKLLYNYLNILNKREKEIIIKRYGLFNNEEQTQKEIAKEFNISRSYVSRIEKRALTKMLREFIKQEKK